MCCKHYHGGTKYRQLPSTVIIFITQDNIFDRDLAKYTFAERCEEIDDLYLEDGTGRDRDGSKGIRRVEGELIKLFSLIRKKQKRGCSAFEIADALEEEVAYVEEILALMNRFPDKSEEELAARWAGLNTADGRM